MTKVFVSGCFDLLHSGHIEFLTQAAELGDLYVALGADETVRRLKNKTPVFNELERKSILESLKCVHKVFVSPTPDSMKAEELKLDFVSVLDEVQPDIFFVNADGSTKEKEELMQSKGIKYVVADRMPANGLPTRSTTSLCALIKTPKNAPLRVDFAGGWLDVPKYHIKGEYVVNCAISPTVSLASWPYRQQAGLGGSAAWSLINGLDPVKAELELGCGWQDAAIVGETGICVWQSGNLPMLDFKRNGFFLCGKMAIYDCNKKHSTPALCAKERDFKQIAAAARIAREGVMNEDVVKLAEAVKLSYAQQLEEGMEPLPEIAGALACKYCGSGHGGYALYLFECEERRAQALKEHTKLLPVEPYYRPHGFDEAIQWEEEYKNRHN